jgi:hypothetical protein
VSRPASPACGRFVPFFLHFVIFVNFVVDLFFSACFAGSALNVVVPIAA